MMKQHNVAFSLWQHLSRHGVTLVPNLLFDAYRDLGLNEEEAMALLHLLRSHINAEGSSLSLSDYLMEKMQRSRGEISVLLGRLQKKGLLHLQRDPGWLKPQEVSMQPLYGGLLAWSESPPEKRYNQENCSDGELTRLFEDHFRIMSEFEYDRLRDWMNEDGWPPEVIREALRIAALGRNLNFKYIDRVLENWKRKGCLTLEQVQAENAAYELRRQLRDEARDSTSQTPQHISASRSRRKAKAPFTIGSISQEEETEAERKKRFEKLIE